MFWLFLTLSIVQLCFAESSVGIHAVESKILNQPISYSFYLPNGYSTDTKYPIVYLLHGMGGDHTSFFACGLKEILDSYIENGSIVPTIYIAPNAFNSFYVDKHDGSFNYEQFFFKEFIPIIEGSYSVNSTQLMRSIVGISMGGFGAGLYSVKHKEMFVSCAPMSPALLPENTLSLMPENDLKKVLVSAFGNETYFIQNNFNYIIGKYPQKTFVMPYRVCIGLQDFLYLFVVPTKSLMEDAKMNSEWYIGQGSHDTNFWTEQLPHTLSFVNRHWGKGPTEIEDEENKGIAPAILFAVMPLITLF